MISSDLVPKAIAWHPPSAPRAHHFPNVPSLRPLSRLRARFSCDAHRHGVIRSAPRLRSSHGHASVDHAPRTPEVKVRRPAKEARARRAV
eukprot:6032508-Prymnesium_polylepis.1